MYVLNPVDVSTDLKKEVEALMNGGESVEGVEMESGLYRGESSHPNPNIDQGSWKGNVEGYNLEDYSVTVEVCPRGFRINIDAEYDALHEVVGEIDVNHSVTIYDEEGLNFFENADSVDLLDDRQYLVDYSVDVDNRLDEDQTEALESEEMFTNAYLSESEASNSLFGGRTLQDPKFFGSGGKSNSTVSESQAAVLTAEWMLYNMKREGSSMNAFFENGMESEGRNDIGIRWIIENFVSDEKYPGGIPTASSQLEVERVE